MRPSSRLRLLAMLAAVLLSAGCASDLLPRNDDPPLPPPDESLNPDSLVIGEVVTSCDVGPEPGLPERVLVDLFFPGEGTGPTPQQVLAVQARGGRVMHRFHVPAVRAYVDRDELVRLARAPIHAFALSVPQPRRYDVQVLVSHEAGRGDEAAALVRALGGRIVHDLVTMDLLAAELPDRSLPALRAAPAVRRVDAAGIACLLT